jgi:hypothetical protein
MKVVEKTAFWTRARDDHLRAFYNDRIHVDPAILAYRLGVAGQNKARRVVRRLCDLGLRKSVRYP